MTQHKFALFACYVTPYINCFSCRLWNYNVFSARSNAALRVRLHVGVADLCNSVCWRAAGKQWWAPGHFPPTHSSPSATLSPPGSCRLSLGKVSSALRCSFWSESESTKEAEGFFHRVCELCLLVLSLEGCRHWDRSLFMTDSLKVAIPPVNLLHFKAQLHFI